MKKHLVALLSIALLLPACAFNGVTTSKSIHVANRMESSTILMHIKIHLHAETEDGVIDKSGWGSCSGVYIKDNIILSAAHCVEPLDEDITIKEIWIKHGDVSERAVPVIVDPKADLALLYTPLKGTPIHFADKVVRGEDCWIIGNPLGLVDTITKGIVSQINLKQKHEKASYTIVDAVALPGNSGGAVVDSNCNLIGILTRGTSMLGSFGAAGLGIAVDIATVKAFLAEHNLK
ncbi:MAG: trypsin-like peptidase domain-containing protein [bacterium]